MSLRSTFDRVGLAYLAWLNRREYRTQQFHGLNERPIEYAFVFRQVATFQPARVLDVGTGMTALPALLRQCGIATTAVDNVRDFWPEGMINRHFHVVDDDVRSLSLSGSFDMITCISVLEHIPEHERAMAAMLRHLAPGGYLVLTAPYTEGEYCPNVYELEGSSAKGQTVPYATQAFSGHERDAWLALGAKLVEQEYWQFYDAKHWSVGRRLDTPKKVTANDTHQISCLLLQKT